MTSVMIRAGVALAIFGVLAVAFAGVPWWVALIASALLVVSLVATWHYVN